MRGAEGFGRPTARPRVVAPWLVELVRTLPGLVRSYKPGAPIDPRTRQRIILAVTDEHGCPYTAWIHESWSGFLGDGPHTDVEPVLLAYARGSAVAGQPLDAAPLGEALPPAAVEAVRAAVAQTALSNLVGNSLDGLVARLRRRRPYAPATAVGEALAVLVAAPLALPLFAAAGAMRLATRLAPAAPAVEVPPAAEANLLVGLLADAARTHLGNALVRLIVVDLPVTLAIGVKAGRMGATVRVGRGAVSIINGIARDVVVIVEGDVEPLLRMAAGTIVGELAGLEVRPRP